MSAGRRLPPSRKRPRRHHRITGNDVGERLGADAVDTAGPAFFSERTRVGRQLGARDDFRCTETSEVVRLFRPARRSDDAIAELCQNRDRDRSDAARGARDDDGALRGHNAGLFDGGEESIAV